jgi:hypothetical protein
MNDADFIELLNLYIDHEIDSDGAARLEAEVARDPERRRLYRQYCSMHKACSCLARATTPADAKTGTLTARRSVGFPLFATGLLAAAAAAFMIVTRPQRTEPLPKPSPAVAAVAPAPVRTEAFHVDDMRPVFSTRAFAAGTPVSATAWTGSLAWLKTVQLAPIPPAPPSSPSFEEKSDVAPFGSRPSEPTEINSIEYQK